MYNSGSLSKLSLFHHTGALFVKYALVQSCGNLISVIKNTSLVNVFVIIKKQTVPYFKNYSYKLIEKTN